MGACSTLHHRGVNHIKISAIADGECYEFLPRFGVNHIKISVIADDRSPSLANRQRC